MHIMWNNMLSSDLNYTMTFSQSFSSSVWFCGLLNLRSRKWSHITYIVPGIRQRRKLPNKVGLGYMWLEITGISGHDSRLAKF